MKSCLYVPTLAKLTACGHVCANCDPTRRSDTSIVCKSVERPPVNIVTSHNKGCRGEKRRFSTCPSEMLSICCPVLEAHHLSRHCVSVLFQKHDRIEEKKNHHHHFHRGAALPVPRGKDTTEGHWVTWVAEDGSPPSDCPETWKREVEQLATNCGRGKKRDVQRDYQFPIFCEKGATGCEVYREDSTFFLSLF
ncbi:hypothetical protein CDAR_585421 [Caerostris darwini]|uniref:Uncharacterized protein n=1 Tax=Caerostris darwini TaxID=1538125 RepID=A0AAV4WZZ4_9ARAC|nr:hypothetical protein CDAR_585421 [Caerostris darwini]